MLPVLADYGLKPSGKRPVHFLSGHYLIYLNCPWMETFPTSFSQNTRHTCNGGIQAMIQRLIKEQLTLFTYNFCKPELLTTLVQVIDNNTGKIYFSSVRL